MIASKLHKTVVLVLAVVAAICAGPMALNAAAPRSGEGLTIWFDAGGSPGESFATIVQNGTKAAQNDLGCKLSFVYSDWNPEKMIENLKQGIAAKPDGIVLMGLAGDDATLPLIDEAYAKGIRVTCVDTNLPKSLAKYQSKGFGFIGTDYDVQGSVLAQEALARSGLKTGERAFVWGLKSLEDRGRRARAIIRVLENAGAVVDYVEISPEINKDASLGTPVVTAYLANHADCRLMIVDHGALTAQMENFLKAANVGQDKIYVAGFSLSPATATAIENGYVDLVSEMQPYLLGYLSVVQTVMTKRYGFSGLNIDTGGGLIHKGNIGQVAPLAKQAIR
jgi:simple sugar transport system substrate-binding protein